MTAFRTDMRAKYPKTFAARDRGSYMAAVRSQCLECVGDSKEDVRTCTDTSCPLYPVRPYKTEAEAKPPAPRSPAQLEAARQGRERLASLRAGVFGIKEPLRLSTHADATSTPGPISVGPDSSDASQLAAPSTAGQSKPWPDVVAVDPTLALPAAPGNGGKR